MAENGTAPPASPRPATAGAQRRPVAGGADPGECDVEWPKRHRLQIRAPIIL